MKDSLTDDDLAGRDLTTDEHAALRVGDISTLYRLGADPYLIRCMLRTRVSVSRLERSCDLQSSALHAAFAARMSATFSSTVSFTVMARSTTSSTALRQAASAGATASGVSTPMAVSTGFTPMRAKLAA